MRLLIDRFISKIQQNTDLNSEEVTIAEYGIDILLYTIISTGGLLFWGILFHEFQASSIIIFVFYLNQTFGGGYHASSHKQCFIFMSFWVILALLLIHLSLVSTVVITILGIFSFIILFSIPVVLHPGRAFLSGKLSLHKHRMYVILVMEIALFLIFKTTKLYSAFSLGLVISSISRIVAHILRVRSCNQDNK